MAKPCLEQRRRTLHETMHSEAGTMKNIRKMYCVLARSNRATTTLVVDNRISFRFGFAHGFVPIISAESLSILFSYFGISAEIALIWPKWPHFGQNGILLALSAIIIGQNIPLKCSVSAEKTFGSFNLLQFGLKSVSVAHQTSGLLGA